MIFDKENLFSNKQSVAASAAGEHVVDLGPMITPGADIPAKLTVTADGFGGTGTLSVSLETADDSAMSVNKRTVATYPVDNMQLKAGGAIVRAGLPMGCGRYARLQYTVGGTITAGTITAGLTL